MYAMAVPNSKLIVLNPVIITDLKKSIQKAELIFAQINVLSQRVRSAFVSHVTQRQRGYFSVCNLHDRRPSTLIGLPHTRPPFQQLFLAMRDFIDKSSMEPRSVNRECVAYRLK
jgi:hypothetical protein